jgi:hypothetical protein
VLNILDYPDDTSFFKVLAGLETACVTIVLLLYPVTASIVGFVKL